VAHHSADAALLDPADIILIERGMFARHHAWFLVCAVRELAAPSTFAAEHARTTRLQQDPFSPCSALSLPDWTKYPLIVSTPPAAAQPEAGLGLRERT
jgi:hypothetical protein